MTNVAIQGVAFGDEAKAAITYRFSKNFDYVIRTAGGQNAGHTIYSASGVKMVRHLVPAVDFDSPNTIAFLGSNMVINLAGLLEEVKEIAKIYPEAPKRIIVDPNAFIVTEEHITADKKNNASIGTTNKGIGPAYLDKISRKGKKIIDCMYCNQYASIDYPEINELLALGVRFRSSYEVLPEMASKKCLFEGAQGIFLDVNLGTYPYVTSTDVSIASIIASGFASIMPKKVYGITKAYTTRVGNGPFPTEIFSYDADYLRTLGKEVGSTTGRNRRCGWLDLPALKYACDVGGITDLIVTKLDVLNDTAWTIPKEHKESLLCSKWNKIPVCTSYDRPITGPDTFFNAKPNYEYVDGWNDASDFNQIKHYLHLITSKVDRPISYISFGVGENDFKSVYE